ncbi:MAG: bifunctional 2-polyprenyl-6-hydroxyphenol methylase/3-demethylubiquinol 3-O-methyltransferase UbiG, partial [Pseudomonadota bacterium]|nr:bifunctional 2-polyprenyl-6-hydroxyphenol methylase/3-demethylubiquinol 3-O-methyltransferase UbiG [Pseudomonadota bacterium]
WDTDGPFRPLHQFNPIRLRFIRDRIAEHFGRDALAANPLQGLRLLDIGSGGGLLAEPLTRLGAQVIGIDAAEKNIKVATLHAELAGLSIDYRHTTAETLLEQGECFDVVLNMEVVEHVSDVELFVSRCAAMVRPGGLMFVATINRTPKAWALAIFAAENVLRWLPRGTHDYARLVRPAELEAPMQAAGLAVIDRTGVFYNPLADRWNLSRDMDVNYMLLARRP